MNQPLPVTIYKSVVGLLAIFGAGLSVIVLAIFGVYDLWITGDRDLLVGGFLALIILVVALITIERIYVYSLSTIELTADGVVAINYRTLFARVDSKTEWFRVQDVSVVTGGIFNSLFNYGTLHIQTSGSQQQIRMTMVPRADYWQEIIAAYADQATVDGSDLSTTANPAA